MSDNDRRYAFHISRGGQGPIEEYEKRESELSISELNLLTGELLQRIDDAPKTCKKAILRHYANQIDKYKS
jgi:hypothetical protein